MNASMNAHSLRRYARIAGFLYLLIIAFGLVAQIFVRDALIDYADATATAERIIASEFLFRIGFAGELAMLICDVAVAMILYVLFRHVSRELALLSTFFRLTSVSILAVTALTHYAAIPLSGGAPFLDVFNKEQLHALALFFLKLHGSGYNISMLFFGAHLLFLGYMIAASDMIPKVLGILIAVAGACYIINTFVWFLFPAFVPNIYPGILVPCFIGELFVSLWLLFKGIQTSELRPT
jgi:hypothetical protein